MASRAAWPLWHSHATAHPLSARTIPSSCHLDLGVSWIFKNRNEDSAVQRSAHTAREIQEELERVASVLCEHDEDLQLDFSLPEPASGEWPFEQN